MDKKKIIEELQKEKDQLSTVIRDTERRLKTAPEGQIRVVKHRKGYQFYLREQPSDTSGIYIPVSEKQKAIALIQKKYDQQILTAAQKQLTAIAKFLKEYQPGILKNIYELLPEVRKENIKPVEISDREYVEKWLSAEYPRKEFSEETPEHYTSNGERVRSKSEVMIADALRQAGIPYRYECPLELGQTTVHPDFTILRTSDRKLIYWEHLGMMDDPDYCRKAFQKLRKYEANGIYPGVNLIITMETAAFPINLSIIKSMIRTFCI